MTWRSRAGERGFWFLALGVEGLKLAALILIPATVVLVGAGAYGAATYDQQHSRDPLAGADGQQASHPSVSFTEPSPVGLHEDCILKVAAESGLSWDGGGLGWTAQDPARLRGADGLDDQKVRAWRDQMTGLLARVSKEWGERCDKADLPSPSPSPSREPEAPVDVDGTYSWTYDNHCSPPDTSVLIGDITYFDVARGGDQIVVTFPTHKRSLRGPISSDLVFKVTFNDPKGGTVDMDGRFAAGTGGDVLLREGTLSVTSGTDGAVLATPCTASFEGKKEGPRR